MKQKPLLPGDRFPLLLYQRIISQRRWVAFWLAACLLSLWYAVSRSLLSWPLPPTDQWLLAGGVVALANWLFAWIGPRLAFVRAMPDHLYLRTPIFRLKVSYRRIESTRPVDLAKLFPADTLRLADRRLLAPFAGTTSFGVDLFSLPVRASILRLFLSPYMLAPDHPGFLLVVPRWLDLSHQLSTRLDAWRGAQQPRSAGPGLGASSILRDE